jgi:hypothetical protein
MSFFFAYLVVPETKGRSLEDMDAIFGGQTASADAVLLDQVKSDICSQQSRGKYPNEE